MPATKQTGTTPDEKRYERPADILRRVPIGRSTLYDLIYAGAVPSYRAGRAILIPAGAIDRYLEEQGSAAKTALGV